DANLPYTITVTNNGPDPAANVNWSDSLPTMPTGITFVSLSQGSGPAFSCTTPAVGSGGTVNCSIASFASGASAAFTLTVHIPAATAFNGSQILNQLQLTSSTPDPDQSNNFPVATTTVQVSADVSITKTGPATAVAGTNISYSITVANSGPTAAQFLNFSDNFPFGTTFVSFTQNTGPAFTCTVPPTGAVPSCSLAAMAAGTSSNFTLVVHIQSQTVGNMVNSASVTAFSPDPDNEDHNATAVTQVNRVSDFAVTKSAPATTPANSNLAYTITVINNGPSDGPVTLKDTTPANTTFVSESHPPSPFGCGTPIPGSPGTLNCSAGSISAGSSTTFTMTVHVDPGVAIGTVIPNTATVTSSSDPNPNDDTATATTNVVAAADLAVTKTDAPDPVGAGNNLTYSITVSNNGPSAAAGVTLTDTIPGGTSFVS